uniref:Uncharacterized protein n=1 Tax=Siphoviridae sp. ct1yA16 TaxID=2827767 RepID=A0A8S5TEP8_9CAUD|nr:MAG TPA: hypothetical protein [Siphoviridae sp. ct1yA16]
MKKNSIEEDIKNAEHFIKSIKTDKEYKEENGWHGYYNKEIVELARILQHILSDYKRVLKENEELKYKVEGQECVIETQAHNEEVYERIFKRLEKENEELKQDKNHNYQMIALVQNEMLGYMQGYEDGKKLNRSAVAYIVENQQYYILNKQIEHYKEYIKKLQKENEEYSKQLDLDYVDKNYISKKKIEDTIEELKGKLEDISKRREKSKTKEEETVLLCLEIRTDERIKTLQELL